MKIASQAYIPTVKDERKLIYSTKKAKHLCSLWNEPKYTAYLRNDLSKMMNILY